MLISTAVSLLAPATAAAWTWPADGPVLRGFDFGGPEYREHGHTGIDVGGEAGSLVRAAAGGEISFAGWLPGNGRTVTIRTADGYAVTLLHLGSTLVGAGDGVAEGEPVGTLGPSGDPEVEVPYVHLGVRRADDPKGYVDPSTLLPPRPAPEPSAPAPGPPAVVEPAPGDGVAPAPVSAVSEADGSRPHHDPIASAAPAGAAPVARRAVAPRSSGVAAGTQARTERLDRPRPAANHVRTASDGTAVRRRPRRSTGSERPAARTAESAAARGISVRAAAPAASAAEATEPRPAPASAPAAPAKLPWAPAAAAALAVLGLALLRLGRPGDPERVRKMTAPEELSVDGALDLPASTHPRRSSVAVCERPPPHRPPGGIRRPGRRVRSLPPAPGQPRPHGQRDGRARNADHGRRRPGRAVVS
jgi:hypothetical protein